MNAGSAFVDAEMGVRGAGGGNLAYNTNGTRFAWFGSGILNKPIGDFGRDGLVRFSSRDVNPNVPYFFGKRQRESPNQNKYPSPSHP